METISDYLEEVKTCYNLSSDYALSKFLDVSRQAISKQRHGGGIDDYTALKIAKALNISPLEVIATRNRERAKSAEEKAAWEKILKSVAACIVSVFLMASPVEEVKSSTSGNRCNVYYAKNRGLRRRLRLWTLNIYAAKLA